MDDKLQILIYRHEDFMYMYDVLVSLRFMVVNDIREQYPCFMLITRNGKFATCRPVQSQAIPLIMFNGSLNRPLELIECPEAKLEFLYAEANKPVKEWRSLP